MSWAAVDTVTRLLRGDTPAAADPVPWEEVILIAGRHLVTPALAHRLSAGDAPPEVRDYFAAVHTLNAGRNADVERALATTLTRLHAAGFHPVLLKGAAALVAGLYDDPAERIVGDLDLLLPAAEMADAVACLKAAGFTDASPPARRWVRPDKHHAPALVEPVHRIAVELHRSLTGQDHAELLPPAAVLAEAGTAVWKGHVARLPSPDHRVAHNVLHDQIQHGGFANHTTELRQLRELTLLARRHPTIGWPALVHGFERAQMGDVLRKQTALARRLLDADLPVAVADADRYVAQFRASLSAARPKRGGLLALARLYAEAFKADPRLALNLLDPVTWPERLRSMRDVLTRDAR